MAEQTPAALNRSQRIIAYMAGSGLVLSVAAILAMVVGSLMQVDFRQGIWSTIAVLPLIGLPFTFLLIIAFFVATAIRRSRASRDAQ